TFMAPHSSSAGQRIAALSDCNANVPLSSRWRRTAERFACGRNNPRAPTDVRGFPALLRPGLSLDNETEIFSATKEQHNRVSRSHETDDRIGIRMPQYPESGVTSPLTGLPCKASCSLSRICLMAR